MNGDAPPSPSLAARLNAVAVTAGICLLLFAAVAWSSTWLANIRLVSAIMPDEAPLLLAVAFLMALGSLAALWWAGAPWPSHLKTLAAAADGLLVWAALVWLLPSSELTDPSAAGWAASLATQLVFAGLAAGLLQASAWGVENASQRFSIFFLLAWTAVLAVMLAVGRRLAEQAGWTADEVLNWDFLLQLQVIGLANAALAVGIFAALRLAPHGVWRPLAAWLVVGLIVFCVPLLMFALFTDVGAEFLDIAWLMAAQGAFLLAALLPQAVVAERAFHQSSTVASNSDSAASDSARPSSR